MSSFEDCEYVILEGGANDGVIIPVAEDTNVVQFHIKGGDLITYQRTAPIEFKDNHIVFSLVE